MKHSALALSTVCIAIIGAPAAQADEMRFVTCPVYRDTDAGKKSGCWLADRREDGVRYDISKAPRKPDWNFAVLVEGEVADDPDEGACGGVTLEPVRVSVLDQTCPRHYLPAENHPGRVFVLPDNLVPPLFVERPPAEGPFEDRTFHVFFDLNDTFITYQFGDYQVDQAAHWITSSSPSSVTVIGHAATEPDSVSGVVLIEDEDIALARAETVRTSLVRLGVSEDIVRLETGAATAPVPESDPDGFQQASLRRVDIEVRF